MSSLMLLALARSVVLFYYLGIKGLPIPNPMLPAPTPVAVLYYYLMINDHPMFQLPSNELQGFNNHPLLDKQLSQTVNLLMLV